MGLLDFFTKNSYDLETIDGIKKIKIPQYPALNGLESPTANIEYILQRKATEHKKNGRMDLAIACLKKSNELMTHSNFTYGEKDYIRYIKYLRSDGQVSLADDEEEKLYKQHPEFKDKRISNSKKIKEVLKKQKEWKNDLVIITTKNSCSICDKYNNKIYSISGKNKIYSKLPLEISSQGGFCSNCYLGICSYFEDINKK